MVSDNFLLTFWIWKVMNLINPFFFKFDWITFSNPKCVLRANHLVSYNDGEGRGLTFDLKILKHLPTHDLFHKLARGGYILSDILKSSPPYFQHFEKLPQNFGSPIKTSYKHIIGHLILAIGVRKFCNQSHLVSSTQTNVLPRLHTQTK